MKEKIITLYKEFIALIEPYKKNLIIPLLKIMVIIIVCAIVAHFMSGNETLLEYAAKHG